MARRKLSQRHPDRPSIFIAGSMKCGTTILFDFLTAHSQVSGGASKEVHYFSLHYHEGERWYRDKFKKCAGTKHFLDASPTYFDMCLDVPTAERIKKFSPNAKIIILIRNPVERAISHFNHLKHTIGSPVLRDIAFDDLITRKWEAEKAAELEIIRRHVVNFSKYKEKIERFVKVFGRDNVMVVHNDDLRSSGECVVNQIFQFLELDPVEGADFSQQRYMHGSEKINVSQEVYFQLADEFGEDY